MVKTPEGDVHIPELHDSNQKNHKDEEQVIGAKAETSPGLSAPQEIIQAQHGAQRSELATTRQSERSLVVAPTEEGQATGNQHFTRHV